MQVVGSNCAVCAARIVTAPDGQSCASCGAALHTGCAAGHVCAGPKKTAAASAPPADTRPAAQRYRWLIIALSVAVASIVVPRFRSWRADRAIAERVAHRLGCTAAEVEIDRTGPGVTARGCGTSVHYMQVCGQIDRAECLEEIEVAPGR